MDVDTTNLTFSNHSHQHLNDSRTNPSTTSLNDSIHNHKSASSNDDITATIPTTPASQRTSITSDLSQFLSTIFNQNPLQSILNLHQILLQHIDNFKADLLDYIERQQRLAKSIMKLILTCIIYFGILILTLSCAFIFVLFCLFAGFVVYNIFYYFVIPVHIYSYPIYFDFSSSPPTGFITLSPSTMTSSSLSNYNIFNSMSHQDSNLFGHLNPLSNVQHSNGSPWWGYSPERLIATNSEEIDSFLKTIINEYQFNIIENELKFQANNYKTNQNSNNNNNNNHHHHCQNQQNNNSSHIFPTLINPDYKFDPKFSPASCSDLLHHFAYPTDLIMSYNNTINPSHYYSNTFTVANELLRVQIQSCMTHYFSFTTPLYNKLQTQLYNTRSKWAPVPMFTVDPVTPSKHYASRTSSYNPSANIPLPSANLPKAVLPSLLSTNARYDVILDIFTPHHSTIPDKFHDQLISLSTEIYHTDVQQYQYHEYLKATKILRKKQLKQRLDEIDLFDSYGLSTKQMDAERDEIEIALEKIDNSGLKKGKYPTSQRQQQQQQQHKLPLPPPYNLDPNVFIPLASTTQTISPYSPSYQPSLRIKQSSISEYSSQYGSSSSSLSPDGTLPSFGTLFYSILSTIFNLNPLSLTFKVISFFISYLNPLSYRPVYIILEYADLIGKFISESVSVIPRKLGLWDTPHQQSILLLQGYRDAPQLPTHNVRISLQPIDLLGKSDNDGINNINNTKTDFSMLKYITKGRLHFVIQLEGIIWYMYHWYYACLILGTIFFAIVIGTILIFTIFVPGASIMYYFYQAQYNSVQRQLEFNSQAWPYNSNWGRRSVDSNSEEDDSDNDKDSNSSDQDLHSQPFNNLSHHINDHHDNTSVLTPIAASSTNTVPIVDNNNNNNNNNNSPDPTAPTPEQLNDTASVTPEGGHITANSNNYHQTENNQSDALHYNEQPRGINTEDTSTMRKREGVNDIDGNP